ncbi:MAG: putative DNA-binding transcriptional regulator [Prokaryotic dsDNA virus sp.]|nr:MAG: putative DNA-binding transcriptional regulator [Prokaryotic dsDNA virus sp.]|tara:strand:- start:2959 stop:3228 length:270 start_codon:yes stop_codon:yes gene_type:complete
MNQDYVKQIEETLNKAVNLTGVSSANALARRLDVSKQALSKWKKTGIVPAHRACQIELLTGGAISWKDLCPDIVDDFNSMPNVNSIARK